MPWSTTAVQHSPLPSAQPTRGLLSPNTNSRADLCWPMLTPPRHQAPAPGVHLSAAIHAQLSALQKELIQSWTKNLPRSNRNPPPPPLWLLVGSNPGAEYAQGDA